MTDHLEQGHGKIIFWLLTIMLLAGAGILIWPFVPALLWATVLSVLFYPMYRRSQEKFKKRKSCDTMAALSTTLFTAAVIILPLVGLAAIGGIQVYNLATEMVLESGDGQAPTAGELAGKIDQRIDPILKRIGLEDFKLSRWIDENKEEIAQALTGPALNAGRRLVVTIVTLVIALLTMFFMLRDGHRLINPVVELIPLPRDHCIEIIKKMGGTIRSVFWSVFFVAIIQGLMCGALYWWLGVDPPAVWMLVTAALALIPLLGAPIVYIPASLILMLEGNTWQGVTLLLIGFLVVSQIDNLLRPMFISMGSKLHTMAVFFSLLGGVLALGPIGLMAGPMLLTLILGLTDVLRERRRIADGLEPVAES
ncbi:MAG: AI-2E family transporter [Armatimonadetes bacterium]|nr:AI-2E family transporter [Armatimonadota bacterium]